MTEIGATRHPPRLRKGPLSFGSGHSAEGGLDRNGEAVVGSLGPEAVTGVDIVTAALAPDRRQAIFLDSAAVLGAAR